MKTPYKQIILAVTEGSMNAQAAARHFNISERWVKELIHRYATEGETAFKPRSKRPRNIPHQTSEHIRERIITLRQELSANGLDAGAQTIQTHLENEGLPTPARSTIHRILRQANHVIDQPQKRPKTSLIRFEADQPNERWQADFTHWRLEDGTDTEILDFIDDHSRFLISIHAYRRVTGKNVRDQFIRACHEHGRPYSTLTDNGLVFTTRLTGKKNGDQPVRNAFEQQLRLWQIRQINGSPNHPQTQGKIERFHRTLKRWLTAQPRARTVRELNTQLARFTQVYNEQRPHRGINNSTPSQAYYLFPKAHPKPLPAVQDGRLRTDTVDKFGKLTLRYDGKLRHLGMGVAYAGVPVRMMINDLDVVVISRKTGEILRYFKIDPAKNYQRPTSAPE